MKSSKFILLCILSLSLLVNIVYSADLDIVIQPMRDFFYIDDPISIAFSIVNNSESKIIIHSPPLDPSKIILKKGDTKIPQRSDIKDHFQPFPLYILPRVAISQNLDIKNLFAIDQTGIYELYYNENKIMIEIIDTYDPAMNYMGIIETEYGKIEIRFFKDKAPKTVKNFIDLANRGFYNGLTFHRVIENFVIQGGCPRGDGTGGPGYTIDAEINNLTHKKGTISMARGRDLDSAGSQFFICLRRLPELDNNYTVFGEVIEGMEIIEKISRFETTGHLREPFDMPLEPVYILSVEIREKN